MTTEVCSALKEKRRKKKRKGETEHRDLPSTGYDR